MKSASAHALGWAAAIFLIVLLGVVRAWAITVLWSWFVAPTFGLPEISKVTAFGLAAFVSLFSQYESKEKHGGDWAEVIGSTLGTLVGGVVGAISVVAICWVVKLFA